MVALPAGNRPGRASPLTNTGRDGKTTLSRCGGSLPGERGFLWRLRRWPQGFVWPLAYAAFSSFAWQPWPGAAA